MTKRETLSFDPEAIRRARDARQTQEIDLPPDLADAARRIRKNKDRAECLPPIRNHTTDLPPERVSMPPTPPLDRDENAA